MKAFRIILAFGLVLLVFTPILAQEGRRERPRPDRQQQGERPQRRDRQQRPERVNPLMAALDTDKNGILSSTEIAAAVTSLKTLDRNKDGSIQPDELRPPNDRDGRPTETSDRGRADRSNGGNAFVERVMARDADKDGKVSKEEAGEQMANFFRNMDSDKDGFLTKSELEEMSKRFQRSGNRGGGGGRAGGGQQPNSKDNRPPFDND